MDVDLKKLGRRNTQVVSPTGDVVEHALRKQVEVWKQAGVASVWLTIPVHQSMVVAHASSLGFSLHHTRSNTIVMNKWLPTDRPSPLPDYASHYVGVGGFVFDDKTEKLLVIKELHSDSWKLPGGTADQGEDIPQTAQREILEETGIRTKFERLICFRELHEYRFGKSDYYMIARMTPVSTDIKFCRTELSAAQWMPIATYRQHLINNKSKMNLFVLDLATKGAMNNGSEDSWSRTVVSDNYKSREKNDNPNKKKGRTYNIYHH
jgi:8-oxo-dGTP pyrophosphatase MutT (NUDIX family)